MSISCAGNYDEGFGREQHKTKWTGKGSDPSAPGESPAESRAAVAEHNGNHEEMATKVEESADQASPVVNGELHEVTAEA